jgi:hypothetical protein
MRGTVRVVMLSALALLLAATPAQASRRSALAGNLLIEDVKDIFFFPHDVARYVNYVWFDFLTGIGNPLGSPTGSGDPMLGSGGILFGNPNTRDFGFGIATHRADHQGALRNAFTTFGDYFSLNQNSGLEDSEPIYGLFELDTLQWIDLLAGFSVSRDIALGVRLSIGSNVFSREDRRGDDSGQPDPGASATSVDFVFSAGIGRPADPMRFDVALEVMFASYGHEELVAGDEVQDEGSTFALALGGRALIALAENIDLGLIAGIETRSKSVELHGDRPDNEASELGFFVGAGPVYTIGEEAIVSAYATLGVSQRTVDPEGPNNLIDVVAWLLPGVRISAEWWLTEWFAYRAGLSAEYRLLSGEQQQDSPSGGDEVSARSLLFYWSNGIGLQALDGDFHLDAMLNWPIITNGPYILSGNSNAMFAMVTASYSF